MNFSLWYSFDASTHLSSIHIQVQHHSFIQVIILSFYLRFSLIHLSICPLDLIFPLIHPSFIERIHRSPADRPSHPDPFGANPEQDHAGRRALVRFPEEEFRGLFVLATPRPFQAEVDLVRRKDSETPTGLHRVGTPQRSHHHRCR